MDVVPETEAAVTVSEQRLAVATEWTVSGRVRVQRRIVTERRTVEIEVRREIVELHGDALDFREGLLVGTELDGPPVERPVGDAQPLVVVLREEVPVVTMQVRPYEQVTLLSTLVSAVDTVTDTVQREQVEMITDDGVIGADAMRTEGR